jgi:hypothetical protein
MEWARLLNITVMKNGGEVRKQKFDASAFLKIMKLCYVVAKKLKLDILTSCQGKYSLMFKKYIFPGDISNVFYDYFTRISVLQN